MCAFRKRTNVSRGKKAKRDGNEDIAFIHFRFSFVSSTAMYRDQTRNEDDQPVVSLPLGPPVEFVEFVQNEKSLPEFVTPENPDRFGQDPALP
jgi:hypothetical protein